jgi:hypothetical protein
MAVLMVHADGTDCLHPGTPQATLRDEGGPRCPAGQPVTHIRVNGRLLTFEEAAAAFGRVADALAKAITPLISEFAVRVSAVFAPGTPAIRALAAAAQVIEAERENEEKGQAGG